MLRSSPYDWIHIALSAIATSVYCGAILFLSFMLLGLALSPLSAVFSRIPESLQVAGAWSLLLTLGFHLSASLRLRRVRDRSIHGFDLLRVSFLSAIPPALLVGISSDKAMEWGLPGFLPFVFLSASVLIWSLAWSIVVRCKDSRR